MTKLKGLLLTEGMHGMISQVEGLAKALNLEFIHEKIELNNFWKMIPPKFTPVKDFVFKNDISKKLNVVISCGRKSVVPSIFLKNKFGNKIMNIHIQDPKVSLKNFDYIIVPEHDGIKGNNVITSKGAIHYLTSDEIKKNSNYLTEMLNKDKEYLLLILGGPNKYYDYNEKNLLDIFEKIQKLTLKNSLQAIIIPSMRTPQNIIDLAHKFFDEQSLIIKNVDKKAYLSGLAIAKFIIVTCDSTSMISESALTGKPIYIAEIPSKKDDYRFRQFRDLFKKLNIIRTLDNNLETWKYEILDETSKIAKLLKNKL